MANHKRGYKWYGKSDKDRFEEKFKVVESGRWEWQAHLNKKGYGQFRFEGKMCLANRVSYILYKGEIPENKLVCHECDNPCCVNPEHLWLGSNQDNMDDMYNKGRRSKTKCPSRKMYARGCRCDGCCKIQLEYQREYRKNKKLDPDYKDWNSLNKEKRSKRRKELYQLKKAKT